MTGWYIYQSTGNHVGPVPTDRLVHDIAAGKVPRDVHIAGNGGSQWYPLMSVQEVAAALSALERQSVTAPARQMESAPPLTPPVKEPSVAPPIAPQPSPQAVPQPMQPQAAPRPQRDAKPEEKKAAPTAGKYRWVPYAIFGAFVFIALVEVGVAAAMRSTLDSGEPAAAPSAT